jgi:transposase-like protein
MPVKKQLTTKLSKAASSSQPASTQTEPLPDQAQFYARIKQQARMGLRVLLEGVMQAELEALLQAAWAERTGERQGYRNGFYQRNLATTQGVIEDLQVPRDREGQFHTQVFERYARYEPQVEEGLRDMFVAGVSTGKVGEVAEQLIGVKPSASAVSRLNGDLVAQFKAWRERPLKAEWRIFYPDGIYFEVRHGEQVDRMVVLAVLGVDPSGDKEILGLRMSAEESKEGWVALFSDLRKRGVTKLDLAVSDGNDGLITALKEVFPATPLQRCVVHKQRNVVSAVPKRVKGQIGAEGAAIWQQPVKENARMVMEAFKLRYAKTYPEAVASLNEGWEETLTFYDFEPVMQRYIKTTNAIESTFSQVRGRTDQVDAFTNEESCLMLVWATLQGITFQRIPV